MSRLSEILAQNAKGHAAQESRRAAANAVSAAEIRGCLAAVLNDAMTNALHNGEPETYAFVRTHHADARVRAHITRAVENRDTCPFFESEMLKLARDAEVPVLVYNTQSGGTLFIFGREVANPKKRPAPDAAPQPSMGGFNPQLRPPK